MNPLYQMCKGTLQLLACHETYSIITDWKQHGFILLGLWRKYEIDLLSTVTILDKVQKVSAIDSNDIETLKNQIQ